MPKYNRDEYTAYPEIMQDFNNQTKWEVRIYNRSPDGRLLGVFPVKGVKQDAINAADARMEPYRKKK